MVSSQRGAVARLTPPRVRIERAEIAETMGSSRGGAVNACSVPTGRAESNPAAASAFDTDQGNSEDPPVVLSGRETHALSS